MKSYTDIKQSAQLALLLPVESADMAYDWVVINKEYSTIPYCRKPIDDELPCWSLAALLSVYPMIVGRDMGMYCCWQNHKNLHSKHYNNPVDACYEMVLKLNEQKLI